MKRVILHLFFILIFNYFNLLGQSTDLIKTDVTDNDILLVPLSQLNSLQNVSLKIGDQNISFNDKLNTLAKNNISPVGSGDTRILNTVGWLAFIGGAIGYGYDEENKTTWQIVGIVGLIVVILTY